MRRHSALAFLLVCATLVLPATASAKSSVELFYSQAQIFSGALRFLRIDRGYKVTEQDADAAYLLFEYPNRDDRSFGAVEIVPLEGRVKLTIKLPKMPSYHERVLQQALLSKLKEDYGPSKSPPPKKPEAKAPDEDQEEPGTKDKTGKDDEKAPPKPQEP